MVSHYRITSVIGRGGMGVVYRATDLNLGRDVALKCVRPERDDPGRRARLLREARSAARLSHPNIVKVHEVFEIDDAPAVAMELIGGESLRARLLAGGALPLDELLRHGEELASALHAAHESGILHRDVNPNNVLITRAGHAMLTDFGLVRRWSKDEDGVSTDSTITIQTAPGSVAGTPGYLAPEQILGRPLDPRADIFLLGLVIYEMATGVRAFPIGPGDEMADAILNREPIKPTSIDPRLPAELETIVRKALAKQAEHRYATAAQLEADLRALRRKTESDLFRTGVPRIRRRLAGLLAAAAVTLLAGVGGYVAWRGFGPPLLSDAVSRQLTSGPGIDAAPEISADGGFIVYASDEGGNPDVWILDVVTGQPLQITDDAAEDQAPSWLPDGTGVVFASDRGGRPGIWKVSRLGGAPTMIVSDADDPAVSPDGARIAFVRQDTGGFARIWVAPIDAPAQAVRISGGDTGFWDHAQPKWSPDGRTICFADFNNLWLVPAGGGAAKPLTQGTLRIRNPSWSADGRRIYFSSLGSGTRAVWRVNASGGAPERITLGTAVEGEPSVSRDGRRLAYSTRIEDTRLLLFDRRTGVVTSVAEQRGIYAPQFAPDGEAVYFLAFPGEDSNLWRVALHGAAAERRPSRVTRLGTPIGTYEISADGRWLAYHVVNAGKREILTMPLSGGIPTSMTPDASAAVQPTWAPDGTRIAFADDRGEGQHLWIVGVQDGRPAGTPRPITSGRGSDRLPAWSPAGGRLAFIRSEGNRYEVYLASTDDEGSEPERRVTEGADAATVKWSPDGSRLLVGGAWGGRKVVLREVDPATGVVGSEIDEIDFGSPDALGDFAVSPDGTRIAFREERIRQDIWVLEATTSLF